MDPALLRTTLTAVAIGGGSLQAAEPRYAAHDTHPAWSPDGTRIAFTSTRTGNSEIFVVDVAGGDLTQLTHELADDRRPRWSPDGERIAFQSMRSSDDEDYGRLVSSLFVMNADGSGVEPLQEHDGGVTMADWSPDGRRLAYLRSVGHVGEPWSGFRRGAPALYDFETGASRPLELELPEGDVLIHGVWLFDWSPDSKRLLFNSDSHRRSTGSYRADLFVADVATGRVEVLTAGWDDHAWPFGADWSPTGRRIALAMNVDEDRDESTWQNRIAVLDLETGELVKLDSPDNAWEPSWSPDGRRIAFAAKPEGAEDNDVFVMDAGGGGLRNLTGSSAEAAR